MTEKIKSQCQTCGKVYEHVAKPGYPRKYCFECSAERKAAYEAKDEMQKPESFPVEKPGKVNLPDQEVIGFSKPMRKEYDKDPVGLAVELCQTLIEKVVWETAEKCMVDAIDRVKQAQEAFS